MKKTYSSFCLFFFGSLLPFLIVGWYFQDYVMIGVLALVACLALSICVFIDYGKGRIIRLFEERNKDRNPLILSQKNQDLESSYYFRKNIW